jgi:hypothetical protein
MLCLIIFVPLEAGEQSFKKKRKRRVGKRGELKIKVSE